MSVQTQPMASDNFVTAASSSRSQSPQSTSSSFDSPTTSRPACPTTKTLTYNPFGSGESNQVPLEAWINDLARYSQSRYGYNPNGALEFFTNCTPIRIFPRYLVAKLYGYDLYPRNVREICQWHMVDGSREYFELYKVVLISERRRMELDVWRDPHYYTQHYNIGGLPRKIITVPSEWMDRRVFGMDYAREVSPMSSVSSEDTEMGGNTAVTVHMDSDSTGSESPEFGVLGKKHRAPLVFYPFRD
ncbi:hypothetical protein BJ508DRAFT_380785 [Ascobolus immersus RN42]|uniref:Uncharacterized protein n=1 Tax=Ascobolus immersus RN42 TaxID=1160509 RepID=A0A3N4HPS3_ASCIM|nr:hypothetical protein BJ508DRAFT_380785 [Ascobolus immersus RN42]